MVLGWPRQKALGNKPVRDIRAHTFRLRTGSTLKPPVTSLMSSVLLKDHVRPHCSSKALGKPVTSFRLLVCFCMLAALRRVLAPCLARLGPIEQRYPSMFSLAHQVAASWHDWLSKLRHWGGLTFNTTYDKNPYKAPCLWDNVPCTHHTLLGFILIIFLEGGKEEAACILPGPCSH